MNKPILQSIVYDNANCPVCLEEYEDPKLFLCCGYSLCRKCAAQMPVRKLVCLECVDKMPRSQLYDHDQEISVISCPLCRQDFPLPKGGVDELPSNPVLKQLLDYTPGNAARKELKKKVNECKTLLETSTRKMTDAMDCRRAAMTEYGELQKKYILQKAEHLKFLVNQQARQLCFQIDENVRKGTEMLANKTKEVRQMEQHILQEEVRSESEKIKNSSSEDILEEKNSILERLSFATMRYERCTGDAIEDAKQATSSSCLTFFPDTVNAEAGVNIGLLMHDNSFQSSIQRPSSNSLVTASDVLSGRKVNQQPLQTRLFNPSKTTIGEHFVQDHPTFELSCDLLNTTESLSWDQPWHFQLPPLQDNQLSSSPSPLQFYQPNC